MFECERQFGTVRGAEIHQLVERAIEDLCPCKRGDPCPIIGPAMVDLELPQLSAER